MDRFDSADFWMTGPAHPVLRGGRGEITGFSKNVTAGELRGIANEVASWVEPVRGQKPIEQSLRGVILV